MSSVEIQDREPQRIISVRRTIPIARLTEAQGESLLELSRLLRERGVAPAGFPVVRYHTFAEGETDVETGVPVDVEIELSGRVERGELPGGRAVATFHQGGHDRLSEAYGRLEQWLSEHGHAEGPAWEVYEWFDLADDPDPAKWPAPADWRTWIIQPIK